VTRNNKYAVEGAVLAVKSYSTPFQTRIRVLMLPAMAEVWLNDHWHISLLTPGLGSGTGRSWYKVPDLRVER
jgi:hypothetical protein